jgi:hypothetical protein
LFFAIFILLGIIIGYLCGGRLNNLKYVHIRMIYLPIAALVFSVIANKMDMYALRHFVSYPLIIVFLFFNIKETKAFLFAGIGLLSNFIVITANNFYMPVSNKIEELRVFLNAYNMLINGEITGYALATEQTKLYFLADIFYIPFWPKLGFFSIGDIILGIGGMLCVVAFMKKKPQDETV